MENGWKMDGERMENGWRTPWVAFTHVLQRVAVRSTAQQKLTHFLRLSDVGTIAMTTPDLLL